MPGILDADENKPQDIPDDVGYGKPTYQRSSPVIMTPDERPMAWYTRGGSYVADNWSSIQMPAIIIGVVLAVSLSIFGIWHHWFKTTPVTYTVDSFSWDRQIEVESFAALRFADWSTPGDAYDVSTSQRIHHWNSVLIGFTEVCSGSGNNRYCSSHPNYIQVPVYQTWYDFTVDRWHTDHWLDANAATHTPAWPSTGTLKTTEASVLGNQRVGSDRKETYTVYISHNDKTATQNIDEATWNRQTIGHEVIGHVSNAGTIRSVNWE